jgi:protein-L-isoaspartate(D-aspartate) O-methyltransferase
MAGKKKVDFSRLREEMVENQLRSRDIIDQKVLKVMAKIPREEFVSSGQKSRAYEDGPLSIGSGQTISQPYIVALMTQLLGLKGKEKVLEIGTGSGYQAAVLSYLAGEVYSIERHQELLEQARKTLDKLGIKNIKLKLGDGSRGWPKAAPFEAIIVTAAAAKIPKALTDQLADSGRLLIPVGRGYWQDLIRLTKKGKKFKKESFGGCVFVPLITTASSRKSRASARGEVSSVVNS